MIREHLELILFFSTIALLLNWIAWRNGFFRLPLSLSLKHQVSFKDVLAVFAIYLGISLLLAPVLLKMLYYIIEIHRPAMLSSPASIMGWLQLFVLSLIGCGLYLFSRCQHPLLVRSIWKDASRPAAKSPLYDFCLGVLAWTFSFPVVAAIGLFCDMLLFLIFGFENYEQVAVRYLKSALHSPVLLSVALATILFAAPIIEEFLFRGILQNWFKRHLGTKAAILLSSFCFALFHLAPSQTIGNISLAISLFVFALFLGFIYERQGSLFASIGLHITFNTMSTARILLFPEG